MGLRLRLILILATTAVLVIGVHGFVRLRYDVPRLFEEDQRNMSARAVSIHVVAEQALKERELTELGPVLDDIFDRHGGIDRIRVFDRDLRLILVSRPPALEEEVPREVLQRVRDTRRPEGFSRRGRGGSFHYYVAPLHDRTGATAGVMEIAHRAAIVDEQIAATTRDLWVRLALLVIALVVVTWMILDRQVLRPLTELLAGMQRVGAGEAPMPLPVKREDEIGKVAGAFNLMTQRLDTARRQLVEETERIVELEKQLRLGERLAMVGKLASAFAHEVGTPLNIISGRAEFLLQTLAPQESGRAEIAAILAQIDRISRIIRSILETARPPAPHFRPVRLADVAEALLPLLRHAARRREVRLTTSIPSDLSPLLADPHQLQQVLLNLLLNAVEATAAGGVVGVSAGDDTREGRAGVTIHVSDTGSGIAAEHLDRIFETFFTTKPAGEGTGLGLAVSRQIVMEHGGEIRVESERGKGTTFSVWLPQPARAET